MMSNTTHRVVIVGGGFGGLHAASNLRSPMLDVTLIDRRNFHLFQPLLYQVATGGLSPANIACPCARSFVIGAIAGFCLEKSRESTQRTSMC